MRGFFRDGHKLNWGHILWQIRLVCELQFGQSLGSWTAHKLSWFLQWFVAQNAFKYLLSHFQLRLPLQHYLSELCLLSSFASWAVAAAQCEQAHSGSTTEISLEAISAPSVLIPLWHEAEANSEDILTPSELTQENCCSFCWGESNASLPALQKHPKLMSTMKHELVQ